jgi:hypothetical protein
MIAIHDFLEPGKSHDRIIQNSLREVDTRELSYLMLDLTEEDQQIILRNMSRRAAKLLKEEMASNSETAAQYRKDEAMEFFLQRLTKHTKYLSRTDLKEDDHLRELAGQDRDGRTDLPRISTADEEDILETLLGIAKFARKNGILELQGIERGIDDPVLRRGIEYYIDGWDPMLVQTILEKYKQVHLRQIENKLNMILEGIDSLTSKDIPMVMEERLKTFL